MCRTSQAARSFAQHLENHDHGEVEIFEMSDLDIRLNYGKAAEELSFLEGRDDTNNDHGDEYFVGDFMDYSMGSSQHITPQFLSQVNAQDAEPTEPITITGVVPRRRVLRFDNDGRVRFWGETAPIPIDQREQLRRIDEVERELAENHRRQQQAKYKWDAERKRLERLEAKNNGQDLDDDTDSSEYETEGDEYVRGYESFLPNDLKVHVDSTPAPAPTMDLGPTLEPEEYLDVIENPSLLSLLLAQADAQPVHSAAVADPTPAFRPNRTGDIFNATADPEYILSQVFAAADQGSTSAGDFPIGQYDGMIAAEARGKCLRPMSPFR